MLHIFRAVFAAVEANHGDAVDQKASCSVTCVLRAWLAALPTVFLFSETKPIPAQDQHAHQVQRWAARRVFDATCVYTPQLIAGHFSRSIEDARSALAAYHALARLSSLAGEIGLL